jgi:hypothetical protein
MDFHGRELQRSSVRRRRHWEASCRKGLRLPKDTPMSEPTGDFQHELMHELPPRRARETLAPWRCRLTALRTNELVVGLLKACLLSVVSCGPIPPVRARRDH